jgi:formylglycine-generating enzyme required for sulfatase activity
MGADRWKYTSPVGSFPANAFGLYDMAGNVWQFVADCWHASYAGAPADGSARTDGKCAGRVVRGGSWLKPPVGERSAKRGEATPDDLFGSYEIGFRVARDLNR